MAMTSQQIKDNLSFRSSEAKSRIAAIAVQLLVTKVAMGLIPETKEGVAAAFPSAFILAIETYDLTTDYLCN